MEAAGIEPASRDISMQASTYVVDPICTLCHRPAPRSTGLPFDLSAAVFNLGRRQQRPETIRNYSRQSELSGEAPQPGLPSQAARAMLLAVKFWSAFCVAC